MSRLIGQISCTRCWSEICSQRRAIHGNKNRELCHLHLNTSYVSLICHVTNFSLRTPGKVVAVLRNIFLAHPEKSDVVNIRSSTKILNLALGNLLCFGSYKLLVWKQKSLQAANNELPIYELVPVQYRVHKCGLYPRDAFESKASCYVTRLKYGCNIARRKARNQLWFWPF